MTDRRDLDRAMTLAEMAPNRSVRFEALADREGEFPDGRLSEPPVTYLEDAEAPAYLLTNRKRGIGIGTKRNTTSPDGDRGTLILVTGRRTLCLVGRDESDETIEIPHESVAAVSYHTGLLGHRLAIETPRKQYHCWVSRDTDESILGRASEYVRERKPAAPYESDDAEENQESKFMYRGQPVTRANHPGLSDEPPAKTEPEQADEQRRDGTDDEPSSEFTYRGQPVTRANHPGLPDDPPAQSERDDESDAAAPGDGIDRSGEERRTETTDDEHRELDGRSI
jgi:hypothetical protein